MEPLYNEKRSPILQSSRTLKQLIKLLSDTEHTSGEGRSLKQTVGVSKLNHEAPLWATLHCTSNLEENLFSYTSWKPSISHLSLIIQWLVTSSGDDSEEAALNGKRSVSYFG